MIEAGGTAPDFTLDSATGGTRTLASILESGPALITFYKVTCPTCQLTLPFLQRLRGGPIQVVAICQDEAEDVREFEVAFGVSLTTLVDHADAGYPVSNAYGITQVPSMFLVAPEGHVAWTSAGFLKRDLMDLGQKAGIEMFRSRDKVPDWKPG